jgi:hypothetical protein
LQAKTTEFSLVLDSRRESKNIKEKFEQNLIRSIRIYHVSLKDVDDGRVLKLILYKYYCVSACQTELAMTGTQLLAFLKTVVNLRNS